MSNDRIVIVGAGIIGLTAARELALRGHKVVLLDKAAPGRGASRVASGIVSPLRPWQAHTVVDRMAATSQDLYADFIAAVTEESSIDCEYINSGMLIVGDTHEAAAVDWAHATGRSLEVIDRAGLTRLVEDIGRMREGVFLPDIHQVRIPALLESLECSCRKLGVDIRPNQEVLQLRENSGRVSGVSTKSGEICADSVVIAAGARSESVVSGLGLRLNITPVRGQTIWYQDSAQRAARPIIDDGEYYLVTRSDGTTLVGGTIENAGFESTVTDKMLKKLMNKAKNLVTGLASLTPAGHWSCLRPARAHGIPLVGAHPSVDGLYLNTGHFRNAVTLAPGSALLLANILEGASELGVGVSTL